MKLNRTQQARLATQIAALVAFLALYARTAYRGEDELTWPVHLVFRLDPLAALAEVSAGHVPDLMGVWFGAVVMVVAAFFLGRFFCGWLCPMGSLIEFIGKWLRRITGRVGANARPPALTGLTIFSALTAATLLGLPLLGFFDPLSILLRSLTIAVFPALDHGMKEGFAALFNLDMPLVTGAVDPVFEWFSTWLLAFGNPVYLLAGLTGVLFVAIFMVELLAPRFWCAHLCPLGTLLGLCGKAGPLGRKKSEECGACTLCTAKCPTGAADVDPVDNLLCIQCTDCAADCPNGSMGLNRVSVRMAPPAKKTRRAVLGAIATGGVIAASRGARAGEKARAWDFLRPPGAVDEEEFNRRCVRCGACMRVCPGNALNPTFLEAGVSGLWTPRLVPRLGYCEYHCRLCGQVCPTGAIEYLKPGDKEKWVIGVAIFDRNRCLPYRNGTSCIVCEEHCPTLPKAIAFDVELVKDQEGNMVEMKLPRVIEKLCIGCGICENKCPLDGRSAIIVSRENPADITGSSYS